MYSTYQRSTVNIYLINTPHIITVLRQLFRSGDFFKERGLHISNFNINKSFVGLFRIH